MYRHSVESCARRTLALRCHGLTANRCGSFFEKRQKTSCLGEQIYKPGVDTA